MAYTVIDFPAEYFDTSLWSGTGATQSISSLNFQPDWLWVKSRSTASNHRSQNSVTGVTKGLNPNQTVAETTLTDCVTSFNSDGFTLGADSQGYVNTSSRTYVGWSWKANGAGVSNTAGTISSTVSANTTSGFSIVSWTGAGSAGTVGHGLGAVPKFIITKKRNNTGNWACYHVSLGNTQYVYLNSTNASATYSGFWNNTTPTSTLISLGTDDNVTGNGDNIIAYCFAEVKGFSKAFSYTGNGSTDGTYVHLGFRPAWIIIKKSDGSVQNWVIHDSKRSAYNLSQNKLFANLSDAEDTGGTNYNLDILSNGFKLRSSNSDVNSSGGAYIGFAVAENPFVSSKGVAVTAR